MLLYRVSLIGGSSHIRNNLFSSGLWPRIPASLTSSVSLLHTIFSPEIIASENRLKSENFPACHQTRFYYFISTSPTYLITPQQREPSDDQDVYLCPPGAAPPHASCSQPYPAMLGQQHFPPLLRSNTHSYPHYQHHCHAQPHQKYHHQIQCQSNQLPSCQFTNKMKDNIPGANSKEHNIIIIILFIKYF